MGDNVFAGTETGVYLTTDQGESWECVGAFEDYVSSLAAKNGYLFAANAAGVWRRPLSEMIGSSAVATSVPTPGNITAYPNPLSQLTSITYASAHSGPTQITILNLLGAEVARLYDGELTAGTHTFSWDASGIAPGMYECVVRSGGRTMETPLMLMR